MGASFYLLLLGTSFAVVIGLAVFSACGWYRSQSTLQSSSQQQNATTTPSRQTKQPLTQVSPSMTAMSVDAFTIKEMKKEKLLEKARRRYLELHPDFVPPTKVEKSL